MATETKATHTEGPWFVDDKCVFPMPIEDIHGIWICQIGGNSLCTDDPVEAEANAHLIAAAPELLAALKEYHAANRLHHDEDARLYDLSEAAIAKAEGR